MQEESIQADDHIGGGNNRLINLTQGDGLLQATTGLFT